MRKRYISLNCTQSETEYRLSQQLRIYFPHGHVEENHFRIYKQTTISPFAKGIGKALYCFCGDYHQFGKNTNITYRVFPGYSVIFSYAILGISLLVTTYEAVFNDTPIYLPAMILVVLLICTLITQTGKNECIKDFNKRLTTETHYT